jgi:hypothetical protein
MHCTHANREALPPHVYRGDNRQRQQRLLEDAHTPPSNLPTDEWLTQNGQLHPQQTLSFQELCRWRVPALQLWSPNAPRGT